MRKAEVCFQESHAGILVESDEGYEFKYDPLYLKSDNPAPISLTFPLSEKTYTGKTLFPFFDGLIPEGWLLAIAEKNWKLNPRDRMGLLLACCRDCIGAVSIRVLEEHS